MKYLIYKITNNVNNKYYIGRHRTKNENDSYMGSGKGILNAIKKYGIENFTKEIIAESWDETNLWELEKIIVNEEVVKDTMSYNMSYGGKHYLHGLKTYDQESYKKHQRMAGNIGGPASYNRLSENEKIAWHKKGRSFSTAATGKTWSLTEITKNKQRKAALHRKKITCECCQKEFDPGNLKRHQSSSKFKGVSA